MHTRSVHFAFYNDITFFIFYNRIIKKGIILYPDFRNKTLYLVEIE